MFKLPIPCVLMHSHPIMDAWFSAEQRKQHSSPFNWEGCDTHGYQQHCFAAEKITACHYELCSPFLHFLHAIINSLHMYCIYCPVSHLLKNSSLVLFVESLTLLVLIYGYICKFIITVFKWWIIVFLFPVVPNTAILSEPYWKTCQHL